MQLLEPRLGAHRSTDCASIPSTEGVGSPIWTSSGQWDTASATRPLTIINRHQLLWDPAHQLKSSFSRADREHLARYLHLFGSTISSCWLLHKLCSSGHNTQRIVVMLHVLVIITCYCYRQWFVLPVNMSMRSPLQVNYYSNKNFVWIQTKLCYLPIKFDRNFALFFFSLSLSNQWYLSSVWPQTGHQHRPLH